MIKKKLVPYTIKCNPHFLVHARSTHLSDIYGFSTTQLKAYRGWTDERPGKVYIHTSVENLINSQLAKKESLIFDKTVKKEKEEPEEELELDFQLE